MNIPSGPQIDNIINAYVASSANKPQPKQRQGAESSVPSRGFNPYSDCIIRGKVEMDGGGMPQGRADALSLKREYKRLLAAQLTFT